MTGKRVCYRGQTQLKCAEISKSVETCCVSLPEDVVLSLFQILFKQQRVTENSILGERENSGHLYLPGLKLLLLNWKG